MKSKENLKFQSSEVFNFTKNSRIEAVNLFKNFNLGSLKRCVYRRRDGERDKEDVEGGIRDGCTERGLEGGIEGDKEGGIKRGIEEG